VSLIEITFVVYGAVTFGQTDLMKLYWLFVYLLTHSLIHFRMHLQGGKERKLWFHPVCSEMFENVEYHIFEDSYSEKFSLYLYLDV
jgi:hypothetical protein